MMVDTLLTNTKNVSALARLAADKLMAMADLLDSGDEAALRTTLAGTQAQRRQVYS